MAPTVFLWRFWNVLSKRKMSDRILIIDFGSQVTQLIARRVREAGVYCEIHHRRRAAR